MSLQDLLNYQEKDKELYAIESDLNNSEASKKYKSIGARKVKELDDIKNSARKIEDLTVQIDKICKEIDSMQKELGDLLEVVDSFQEMREIDLYEKKVAQMSKNIDIQDSEQRRIAKQIEDINTSSRSALVVVMKITQDMDSLYKDLEKMKANSLPRRKEIMQELKVLEEKIEPELMNKYKSVRKNCKMPVVVKLNSMSCGGCFMDVSRDSLNKMGDGIGECSNCGRIIYE